MPDRASLSSETPAFVRRFRNLTGVPSYHYDASFGRIVHELFASERPSAVALELPKAFRRQLQWAATCWPTPVAAIERHREVAKPPASRARDGMAGMVGMVGMIVPFVPGDSIFEAYRLAARAGVEVALVDLDVSVPGETRSASALALGPEFAARPGHGFFAAADALNRREAPLASDLAREAAMAAALAVLMDRHASVWWVGGFAHWARIVQRLEAGNFLGPDLAPVTRRHFTRARLASSALLRLTGLYPAAVAQFARAPKRFEPFGAMRTLLHQAAARRLDRTVTPPESASAIDLARTGLYARNLAASARVGEQPQLSELVLAANATIGPRYAARVFAVATAERPTGPSANLHPLTFEVDPATARLGAVEAGFCFRGQRLSAEPWFGVPWPVLAPPDEAQLTREAHDAHYEDLPAADPGDTFHWHAYPADEEAYEGFVRYALRRASQRDPDEGPSVPFVSGLDGGLDVRATIRFSHEDQLYVRQQRPSPGTIRNGVIDWTSRTEDSKVLQGRGRLAGWNDPDSAHVGSVSRECGDYGFVHANQPCVTLRRREWSFITLDFPTCATRPGTTSLWEIVIKPLVDFEKVHDDVYDWLELVFRFCEGKPFVYYSRYTPSARITALARAHKVRLQWCPLEQLSPVLRARHGVWRQMWLADSQWDVVQARLAASKGGIRVQRRRTGPYRDAAQGGRVCLAQALHAAPEGR